MYYALPCHDFNANMQEQKLFDMMVKSVTRNDIFDDKNTKDLKFVSTDI